MHTLCGNLCNGSHNLAGFKKVSDQRLHIMQRAIQRVLLIGCLLIGLPILVSIAQEDHPIFTFGSSPDIDFGTTTPLVTATSSFSVQLGPYWYVEGLDEVRAPYLIQAKPPCDRYDEHGSCVKDGLSLCNYLEPVGKDGQENGGVIPNGWFEGSFGSYLTFNKLSETWELILHTPCFAGECPDWYDYADLGDPLPQEYKNKRFSCDLTVEYADVPQASYNTSPLAPRTVYASEHKLTLHVSAVLGATSTIPTPEPEAQVRTPVLFVPGIMGTEMKKGEEVLWVDVNRMFSEGSVLGRGDTFLDPLAYTPEGVPSDMGVQSGSVLSTVVTPRHREDMDYTTSLISTLAAAGYSTSSATGTLFMFPYDWRKDLKDVANHEFRAALDHRIASSSDGMVDIIAHSQGGLVVKRLLYDHSEYAAHIRKLIFLGTPHLGAPKSAKTLLFGDAFEIKFAYVFGLDPQTVRYISQNMPSVYQLLPTRAYFDRVPSYFGYEEDKWFGDDVHEKFVGYEQTAQALKRFGLNASLIDKADAFHGQHFDETDFGHMGIDITNIVGCRTSTLGSFMYRAGSGEPSYVTYVAGDGTVPLTSATGFTGASRTYFGWSDAFIHGTLPSNKRIHNTIAYILTDAPVLQDPYLSRSAEGCRLSGWQFSLHSPATLHVYDETGAHLGLGENGILEAEIPGVAYDVLGEETFVFVPDAVEDVDEEGEPSSVPKHYTVHLNATASGTMSFMVRRIVDTDQTRMASFLHVPIATSTRAVIDIGEAVEDLALHMDWDGDGVGEYTIQPTTVLAGDAGTDTEPPITTAQVQGPEGEHGWYIGTTTVSLSAEDTDAGVYKLYVAQNDDPYAPYTVPLPIQAEGTSTVSYFAEDMLGNKERPRTLTIRRDTKAPEARVMLDPTTKRMRVEGVDMNPSSVTQSAGHYTVRDVAGHTTVLSFEDTWHTALLSYARLTSVQYNTAAPVPVPRTTLTAAWGRVYTPTVPLVQTVLARDLYGVVATYDPKRDRTQAVVKVKGAPFASHMFPGVELVVLHTKEGQIEYSFTPHP